MMALVQLALRRPYTVAVLSLLVILLGILAVWRTMTAFFPSDLRKNPVVASILGATAAAVECELDGNIPVSPEAVRSKLAVLESRAHL